MEIKNISFATEFSLQPSAFRNQFSLLTTIILCAIIFVLSAPALAQEIVFKTIVNKNRVAVGDNFQVSFVLENADGKNLTPPSFNDFYVVGGPNQSTSMQFINGNMSRSVTFSYFLQAKKEGTFTLQPATIEASGRVLKSNSVNIEVVKSGSSPTPGGQPQQQSVGEQISNNVFVRVSLDKEYVFQGEQVTATYKLYTRFPISNVSFSKLPTFNGFWTQDIEQVQNLQFAKEIYKGEQFDVATLKKVALFPQRSGEIELEALEAETVVRVQLRGRSRSMWDDFFGSYQDVPHKMVSNPVKVKVTPLPTANRPGNFSGVTGNFKMDVKLDKTETNVDDPVTLSIKIWGDGNVKMIEKPFFDLPKDFDVFDPKTNESVTKRGNIVTGYKTYDLLLIPRKPGVYKVPSVSFNYFDTGQKNYVTLQSPEFSIKVSGQASSATSQTITGIKKEEVELLGQDIRFIQSETSLRAKGSSFFGTALFTGAYAAPVLLFIALFAYKRREDEIQGNATLLKKRQATKVASKRLAEAKKYLDENNSKQFYDSVSRAVWGYLGDKLNISGALLSRESVAEKLKEKNVSDISIKKIFSLLDDCEMALFGGLSAGSMNEVYARTSELIDELEGMLK